MNDATVFGSVRQCEEVSRWPLLWPAPHLLHQPVQVAHLGPLGPTGNAGKSPAVGPCRSVRRHRHRDAPQVFPQEGGNGASGEGIERTADLTQDARVQAVLQSLTFTIAPRVKCGIVGATGCGKSTTLLCLLRILEARSGRVLVGDLDISQVGLKLLRTIVGLVPQDATIFEGLRVARARCVARRVRCGCFLCSERWTVSSIGLSKRFSSMGL